MRRRARLGGLGRLLFFVAAIALGSELCFGLNASEGRPLCAVLLSQARSKADNAGELWKYLFFQPFGWRGDQKANWAAQSNSRIVSVGSKLIRALTPVPPPHLESPSERAFTQLFYHPGYKPTPAEMADLTKKGWAGDFFATRNFVDAHPAVHSTKKGLERTKRLALVTADLLAYNNQTFVNDCATMANRALRDETHLYDGLPPIDLAADASPSQLIQLLNLYHRFGDSRVEKTYTMATEAADRPKLHLARNFLLSSWESRFFMFNYPFFKLERARIDASREGLEGRDTDLEDFESSQIAEYKRQAVANSPPLAILGEAIDSRTVQNTDPTKLAKIRTALNEQIATSRHDFDEAVQSGELHYENLLRARALRAYLDELGTKLSEVERATAANSPVKKSP